MKKSNFYWMAAALAFAACGETSTSARRAYASPRTTAPASSAAQQVGRPADARIVIDRDKAIPSSELIRGDVIRAGQPDRGISMPAPSAPPPATNIPNNSAPPAGSGATYGISYEFNGNEIYGEPAVDYRQVAAQEIFAEQVIFAEKLCETDKGDGCEIPGIKKAEEKSGAIKTLLKSVPLISSEKSEINETAAASEIFEEQKLFGGESGNYNEIKVKTPTVNNKLWPGGVPLSAEIDTSVLK